MKSTLIIAYGNLDREDDGVGWHILVGVLRALGRDLPTSPEDVFEPHPTDPYPHVQFTLQLYPELAETIAQYERVCFVDAHTGRVPDDLNIEHLTPGFQQSPFTHHMTPQTCLALAHSLYNAQTEALLVSVRGFSFNFTNSLSEPTTRLAKQAVETIHQWMLTADPS